MLVEAVVTAVVALVLYRRKHAALARCRRTWGDVIEVKERPGRQGMTRHPVIRYSSTPGTPLTFESRFGRSNWPVKPGDRLEILVHGGESGEAEVVGFMVQWGVPTVFALVSVVSFIGAPVVYLLLRP